jgi:TonB family protein
MRTRLLRSLALATALGSLPALAANEDEFMVFDEDQPRQGRETWTWPEVARLDPRQQTVTLEWSERTGDRMEVVSFDDIIRMERARPFESTPDEMFMLLADGRRILVSRGLDVTAHAVLTPTIADLPVKELQPGEGHFPAEGASGPDTRFIIGPGQGLEIRAVAIKDLTDKRVVKANYKPVQYDDADDPNLDGEGGGELERQDIEIVIKQRMGLIRRCYTRELRRDPNLQGTVKVRFVIDEDGSVKYAALRASELGNSIVEDCVVGEIQKLRFPMPDGDGTVVVTYPFAFKGG